MTLTIEATYENGVLKPSQPLPLSEHEKVRVTVESPISWADRTAGIVPWHGDPQTLQQFVMDPEFDADNSP